MKLSIAMAVYNGAKYLPAQLDSFASQTRPPDEIIVSDDGSTDGSVEIIRAWGSRHPELGLKLLEGRGPGNFSGNFARAFAAASGDILFPSDQDDVWFPRKLEVMSDVLARDPGAMVAIHDTEITDSALNPVGQRKMARQEMLGGAMRKHTDGMATAVRVPFLRLVTALPPNVTFDIWMHHCAHALGAKRLVDEPLAYWRRHASAASVGFVQNAQGHKGRIALALGHLRFVGAHDRNSRDLHSTIERAGQTWDWLQANGEALSRIGIPVSDMARLREETADLVRVSERRLAIRRLSHLRRLWPVIRLLQSGGYRHFRGYRAAIKDVVL